MNSIEQFDRDTYDIFVAGHDCSDMAECEICGKVCDRGEFEVVTDQSDGSKHPICDNCMEER